MSYNKFHRRLFCECGYSVYDDGFQSDFFRHDAPCPECGREWEPEARIVRWQRTGPKKNPTFIERLLGIGEYKYVPPATSCAAKSCETDGARNIKNDAGEASRKERRR